MTDKLRYRVLDKESNILYYPSIICINSVSGTVDFDCRGKSVGLCWEDCVINQCTGLKDNNGKLIYDGDVLNVIGKKDCVINFRYLVIQDCEEPTPDNISRYLHIADKADIVKMLRSCNITILGNIHENSELLGNK